MNTDTTTPRYIVVKESLSGHCCFGYTVVDTTYPVDKDGQYDIESGLCECFDEESANIICHALNSSLITHNS